MVKPRIFIGSATETIGLAHDVQQSLEEFAETTVWDQDVFYPAKNVLDSLQQMIEKVDFAIFIFTPTDTLKVRNQTSSVARDNVIFELGLFAGHLGVERCFIIRPKDILDFHLPTDLFGLVQCKYDSNRSDKNLMAALGPACNRIKKTIGKIGLNIQNEVFAIHENIAKSFPPITNSQFLSGYWLSRFDYQAYRQGKMVPGVQYNVEKLIPVNDYCLIGKNIKGVSQSGNTYFHHIKVQVISNYLLGQWFNTNTKNIGPFQLYVHTHNCVMHGCHLGNSNDNDIQSGKWTWIKLDIPDQELSDEIINNLTMKSVKLLSKRYDRWINKAVPIKQQEVLF